MISPESERWLQGTPEGRAMLAMCHERPPGENWAAWQICADMREENGLTDDAALLRQWAESMSKVVAYPIANGVSMKFCWIPPGTATLGSPAGEAERYDHETEHSFTTAGFWLGRFPVTQRE